MIPRITDTELIAIGTRVRVVSNRSNRFQQLATVIDDPSLALLGRAGVGKTFIQFVDGKIVEIETAYLFPAMQ